jgi:dipeptidyl-peptidase-4
VKVHRLAGVCALAGLLLAPEAGVGEKRRLAIEDLTAEPPIAGRSITALTWLDGGARYAWVRKGGDDGTVSELWVADAASGGKRLVASTAALALPSDPPPAKEKGEEKPARPPSVTLDDHRWSPDGRRVLVSGGADLWLLDVTSGRLDRLTRGPEKEEFATFSPDGKRVAFIRGNDLHAIELAGRRETPLTRSGSETVYNGKLDWVYEEELAGRDGRGYEWSPDGLSIAYLRLDDGPVAPYPLTDFLAVPAAVTWQRYPKAGARNPIASFHVVGVDGRRRGAVPPSRDEYVVPGFSWTADSRGVSYRVLNRAQTRQEVRLFSPADAASRVLFVEEDPFWLNTFEPPSFLADGRYLWKSERSGFPHLYVGRVSGEDLRAVTRGEWSVDRVAGVDERSGLVYFTATEENVRRRAIYRVGLDGSGFAKIPGPPGTHMPLLSPDGRHLLDTFSRVDQPPVVSLLDVSGRAVRVVEAGQDRLGDYALGTTEEVTVRADDGTRLEARLVRPPDFDPSRKYPVVVFVYGGPHSQTVRDSWGATSLFDHLLAGRGYLVWSLDNRGTSWRGRAWETAVFRDLGRRELADQLAGVRHVKSLPFVDPARVGIWGWSYGGYMTLYAMTNAPGTWKCGVAGAPVTHWKFYDTIDTERYMSTPAENPEGYERSAPLSKAREIAAPLLLLHGGADDNVHLQNTVAFLDALTKAEKPYELQVQPRQKHGFRGRDSVNSRNRAILRFFEENL